VDVRFKTRQLRRCYEEEVEANRVWGRETARRYIERVNILYRVKHAGELAAFAALRFHELKGKRKEQYALKLTGLMRLIVTFEDQALTIVRVEEVSKHYDD
jgi:proteic killer suppression protein